MKPPNQIPRQSIQWEPGWFLRTDGQTDRMKVKDPFCDCANILKSCCIWSAVKTSELYNNQFCSTHSLLQQTAFHCSRIIKGVPVKQFILSNQISALTGVITYLSNNRLHYATSKHNRTILKFVIKYTNNNPY